MRLISAPRRDESARAEYLRGEREQRPRRGPRITSAARCTRRSATALLACAHAEPGSRSGQPL